MSFWKSLTGRLFKLVFGWYLVLAITVTAVQLGLEYSTIVRDINGDLGALGQSFVPSTADALWSYNRPQLDAMVTGIAQTAYVTGVRIVSSGGETIAQAGTIPSHENAAGKGLLAPYQHQSFPLNFKTPRGEQKQIGQLQFYSDRSVALERIKYSFIVILINSLIKTAGLWLIFYLVITRSLARPLNELTDIVSRVEFAADSAEPVSLNYPHPDELGRLLSAMRKMQERVAAAQQAVANVNQHLEETVASRTQALRKEEAKYRTLFETANDGIFLQDVSGFVDCNQKGAAMYGLAREQVIGRSPAEFCPERQPDGRLSAEVAAEKIGAALQGQPQVFEWQPRRNDGTLFDVEITLNCVEMDGATYLQAIVRDITGRKRAEEELRRLNATLDQRVEEEVAKNLDKEHLLIQQSRLAAMGEMVGNIAHQWRQPINALTLILANIKDAYEFNDLDKEFLEKEVKFGQGLIQKMSSTIDDFRNFFKPNKEKQRFLASDGVEEAIKLVAHSFKNNNIQLTLSHCDEPCTAYGYPNEFAQVVLNALSNAKEAIVDKKINGEVQIKIEKGENAISVAIRDNGGGIPEAILNKVFEPYFTTKEKGTGIGLYMSKMIMDHMGGDIIIRNAGNGTEVLITLPLAAPAI